MRFIVVVLFLITSTFNISIADASQAMSVQVDGIVCEYCSQKIKKRFYKQAAIDEIDVDVESKMVFLKFKKGKVLSKTQIRNLLKEDGYEASTFK